MTITIEAEYLAEQNVLKLTEPLAGVRDHAKVSVEIKESAPDDARSWLALAGALDESAGRELSRAVREAFGREIEV
jgi:hypothetical protein